VITNVALLCYWDQAAHPSRDMRLMIASYVAVLNAFFLLGRELLVASGTDWLSERWTRLLLVLTILISLGIPALAFIFDFDSAEVAVVTGALLCVLVHAIFICSYRYILPDMWSLAATILSLCLLIEAAAVRILAEGADGAGLLFLMGGFTIGLFTMATICIRTISKKVELENA
jgi:hypothetical protein